MFEKSHLLQNRVRKDKRRSKEQTDTEQQEGLQAQSRPQPPTV